MKEGKATGSLRGGLANATSFEDLEIVAQSAGLGVLGSRKATLAARAINVGLEEASLTMLENRRCACTSLNGHVAKSCINNLYVCSTYVYCTSCSYQRHVSLTSLVDTTVDGRSSVQEVEEGIGHIMRDSIGHNKQVLKFTLDLSNTRYQLQLESAKAKETKAAMDKRKEAKVDESKYRCVGD